MTPYYEEGGITIYNGDCREILPTLGPVDLVLTDPPYFRIKSEPWDRAWDNPAAFLSWLASVADLWRSLLKPNGSLYCFASPEMAARVEVMLGERFRILNSIRWMKRNGWHKKTEREALRAYLSPWEAIIFAEPWFSDSSADATSGYGDATRELHKKVYAPIGDYIRAERERSGFTRNDVEVALGYVSSANPERGTALCCRWEEGSSLPTREAYERMRLFLNGRSGDYLRTEYEDLRTEYEDLRTEYEDLRRPFYSHRNEDAYDVWHFDTVAPNTSKHICEKPVPLLSFAIMKSTREWATVLDSFMGAGSVLVAARQCGRKAIGIEANESHCEIAAKRLAQGVLDFGTLSRENTA